MPTRAPSSGVHPRARAPEFFARSSRARMRRFIRYGAIGALATATHYLVLVLCVEGGGWPAWLASGLGAAIGAQVACFGNRRFTFAHHGALADSWLKFQGTALLGAVLGMAVVAAGVGL